MGSLDYYSGGYNSSTFAGMPQTAPGTPRARRSRALGVGLLRLLAALLQQFGHQRGPARLVAGPDAAAVVPVEVLVEEHQVAPVRVGLELLGSAVHRPAAVGIAQEDAGETSRRSSRGG